jgi:hypothetical protein
VTILPLAEAAAKISAKTPIGSLLRSREWEAVPVQLRESGQFSAGVVSARLLNAIQDRLSGELRLELEQLANGKQATFNRSTFINAIRDIARQEGLHPDPKDAGTIRDITSIPRLGLIHDMQTSRAQEYARWKMDQTEGALTLYPAQELVRIEPRVKVRDWEARWSAVGGQFLEGRMVALKTDPIWEKLSRFGTPWPPFDYGSGMGLEDVDYDEAVALGLITPDTQITPSEAEFTSKLEASVQGLSPEIRDVLREHFGDQVKLADDKIRWQPQQTAAHESRTFSQRQSAQARFARSQEAFSAVGSGDRAIAGQGAVAETLAREWASEVTSVDSGRKPLFHEAVGAAAETVADQLRSIVQPGTAVHAVDGQLLVYRPEVVSRLLDPTKPILDQVKARSDDGTLLGYGVDRASGKPTVQVYVTDEAGRAVSGFLAPADSPHLFAAARTQDFINATGKPHSYRLIP